MPAAPGISIAMPIFNTRPFLAEAVESVLAQDCDDWELLLIDDGSTDGSLDLAKSLAEQRPERIRVLQHPGGGNHGISATRNLGLREARGHFFACLDSDDRWLPGKLSAQLRIAAENPRAAMIIGATEYWRPDAPELSKLVPVGAPQDALIEPPELFSLLYPIGEGAAPSMNTVLLKRDIALRLGGWEDRFKTTYEDQAFLCKLYLTEPVFVSSLRCDQYRQHERSIMATELVGDRYARNRHQFLVWLERTMRARRAAFPEEWRKSRAALEDEEMFPYQHPVRYRLQRARDDGVHLIRRVKRRLARGLHSGG